MINSNNIDFTTLSKIDFTPIIKPLLLAPVVVNSEKSIKVFKVLILIALITFVIILILYALRDKKY